jgi:hypothetical protein
MTRIFMTGSLILMLAACSTISKFDQYAYTQTTSLKVDAINVMGLATDSFHLHRADVAGVQTDINKMLEYERNRPKNTINEKMWTLIQDSTGHLFGGFIARWQKEGKLDTVFVKESQLLIGSTFDQISQLESGKIKPAQVTN